MSTSPYDQNITLVANTEQHVLVPVYYERIIVTNGTTATIYTSTNGTPVTTAQGGFGAEVLPSAWRMIGNDQPKEQPINSPSGHQAEQEGWTVQNRGFQGATTPNLNPLASGAATYISVIGSAAGTVTLEFV